MVLPRNITQIGEINSNCKVYVEDYVVSYIKQVNQLALDKPMAVAVYGIKKEEDGVDYLFLYGGAQLDYLCRECRHLSQAQLQEIDRNRKKYFQEYSFLGYCLLSGEMVEGFYIYEQGICRYTAGYARFYEKNDAMLAFMLDNRAIQVTPEVVDETKYEIARNRQEERKRKLEEEELVPRRARESKETPERIPLSFQYRFAKGAVAAVFCLVCVLALVLVSQQQEGNGNLFSAQTWKELGGLLGGEEKESGEQPVSSGQVDKLVIEEKLNQAILAENSESANEVAMAVEVSESIEVSQTPETSIPEQISTSEAAIIETMESLEPSAEATVSQEVEAETLEGIKEPMEETVDAPINTPEIVAESTAPKEQEAVNSGEVVQLTSYTIMSGDTLIGISTRMYGTEFMVKEICKINNISNPDDIKVGAKILLP
ncbi:MAG: LysM peptidoglycan-binding domain-containing protein [Lachnospiraceae bacterium]|nr:LysM peptidoglycan-binding domain-containing protein [Lachnospiraceae bacterium]